MGVSGWLSVGCCVCFDRGEWFGAGLTMRAREKKSSHGDRSHDVSNRWVGSQTSVPNLNGFPAMVVDRSSLADRSLGRWEEREKSPGDERGPRDINVEVSKSKGGGGHGFDAVFCIQAKKKGGLSEVVHAMQHAAGSRIWSRIRSRCGSTLHWRGVRRRCGLTERSSRVFWSGDPCLSGGFQGCR